jgi:hypothetical protein
MKKVEEESESQKKFKRDDDDDIEDEEELIIIERKADPLTVINTPIQDGVAPNLLLNIAGSFAMTINCVYIFLLFLFFFCFTN